MFMGAACVQAWRIFAVRNFATLLHFTVGILFQRNGGVSGRWLRPTSGHTPCHHPSGREKGKLEDRWTKSRGALRQG